MTVAELIATLSTMDQNATVRAVTRFYDATLSSNEIVVESEVEMVAGVATGGMLVNIFSDADE